MRRLLFPVGFVLFAALQQSILFSVFAQPVRLLSVSETWTFDQPKLDALNMRAQDKTDVRALCPDTIKLIDGRDAILIYSDGRVYDTDRSRLDNALATYTLNDPVEGVRGVRLGDVFTTPPPEASAPLDRNKEASAEWRAGEKAEFESRFPP